MKLNKMRSYWLLLLALILGISSVLSVNQTQARYNSAAVWDTVISYEPGSVSSNCLSQQDQIILLGGLAEEASYAEFTLESVREVTGSLTWKCDQDQYVEVGMGLIEGGNKTVLEQGSTINLPDGSKASIVLMMVPTEKALTEPRDEMAVNVTVTFGDLSGVFRAVLPAVVPEETEPEETEPEVTEPEETEPESTEPEETKPEETEPKETEPEATDPPATDPPATDPPATEPPATEPPATDPPATEPPATDPAETEPEETEPEDEYQPPSAESGDIPTLTSGDVPTLTAPEDGAVTIELEGNVEVTSLNLTALGNFDSEGLLPVIVRPSSSAQQLSLGLGKAAADGPVQLLELPAFTRYSWNGKNYLLYHGGLIELDLSGQEEVSLTLDFSDVDGSSGKEWTLGALTYQNGAPLEEGTVKVTADVDASGLATPQYLVAVLNAATESTEGAEFTVTLPAAWTGNDLEFDYRIQMMTAEGFGGTYKDVDLNEGTLIVEHLQGLGTEGRSLRIALAEQLPQAGTYRLIMSFSYKDVCFREVETLFYIRYTSVTTE